MKALLLTSQRLLLNLIYKISQVIGIKLPPFASTSAIVENGDKILVVKLSYKDGYALPGGLLQAHELFEEGLVREVKEETGLTIRVGKLINTYTSADDYPTINHLYHATVLKGRLRSSTEGRASWQKPQQIIYQMAHSDNRQAILDYFRLT